MAKNVIGLFNSATDAQAALRDLENAGFNNSNISFVDSPSSGLDSRLTQAGIPQDDATIYANGVQSGGALVMLQALADDDAQRAADILDRYNIVDVSSRGQNFATSNTTRDTSRAGMSNLYQGGEAVIPIVEEELRVGKREVETGGVRVNTRVQETPVNEQVTVRDETVDVHRRSTNRPASEADLTAFQEGSFEVRERDEEVIVDKQARVVEEVHVKKDVQERTETIQDSVRRTDVDVEEVSGQTRTSGYTETSSTGTSGTTGTTSSGDEGMIERGGSKLGNAAERLTGADIDRDGDVGQRDPRNNY